MVIAQQIAEQQNIVKLNIVPLLEYCKIVLLLSIIVTHNVEDTTWQS